MAYIILRLPEVRQRTGLSRSSIYLAMARGDFPKPISLGAKAVGWIDAEIDDWIERRLALRRATNKPAAAVSTASTEEV
jgi:prophage regulatory protein